MSTRFKAVLLGVAIGLAGCGGHPATQPKNSAGRTTTATAQVDPTLGLVRAARDALQRTHRLSTEVLWRNAVPAEASSWIRGPALEALRSAAAGRRKRGIRVRLIADHFEIQSVRLDPSLTQATAIARGIQRVLPYSAKGGPVGRSVVVDERARIELRRIGKTDRFVVWKVVPLR
jgi:hypothetical protein